MLLDVIQTLQGQLLLGVTSVLLMVWLAFRIAHRRRHTSPFAEDGGLKHNVSVDVEKVIDGDTFQAHVHDMADKIRVRILGIDTPESRRNQKARKDAKREGGRVTEQIVLGKTAKERATELLLNRRVILEAPDKKVIKTEGYGRYIAYVRLTNRRDFGRLLIREGLANDFGWKYPHPRSGSYKKTQSTRTARRKRKALRKKVRKKLKK